MAVASHPSLGDPSARPPKQHIISLSKSSSNHHRQIDESVKKQLIQVVKENDVCGFVVSWPVQADSGRHGAACGRVLFTLEQLLSSGSNSTNNIRGDQKQASFQDSPMTPGRPVCLWTAAAPVDETSSAGGRTTIPPGAEDTVVREDSWGRSPIYSRTCNDDQHIASKHQYNKGMDSSPASIWEDFVQANWPEIAEKNKSKQAARTHQQQGWSSSTRNTAAPTTAKKSSPTTTRQRLSSSSIQWCDKDNIWIEADSFVAGGKMATL